MRTASVFASGILEIMTNSSLNLPPSYKFFWLGVLQKFWWPWKPTLRLSSQYQNSWALELVANSKFICLGYKLCHNCMRRMLFPWMQLCLCICFAFLSYRTFIVLWRLLFHPLAGFPGPKLAAATSLYRTYHEIIRGGEFLNELHRIHTAYGAVIRIGPNELHFNDPSAYRDIYSLKYRFKKEPSFYKCFGVNRSTFGTVEADEAKERRGILGPLFSWRSVMDVEGEIQNHVERLIEQLTLSSGPCNLFLGFRCATLDMITALCFGKAIGALDCEGFTYPLLLTIQASVPFLLFVKSFPWIPSILLSCPSFISSRLPWQIGSHLAIREQVKGLVNHTIGTQTADQRHMSRVYHRLLSEHYSLTRLEAEQLLLEEVLSLLQAGSDTVGNTCTVGTFHVLRNPAIHQHLVQELLAAAPDKNVQASLAVLQTLPYLTAVIKESLRLSHGFVSPLPRLIDNSDRHISGRRIPYNTVVGMSVTVLHNNSDLFPRPEVFDPERWLTPESRELERFLAPFSKGPRMCLGINLAWVELYLIFGNIFRRLPMELYDSDSNNYDNFKDYFIPVHQGTHLHVKVTKHGESPRMAS